MYLFVMHLGVNGVTDCLHAESTIDHITPGTYVCTSACVLIIYNVHTYIVSYILYNYTKYMHIICIQPYVYVLRSS